MSGQYPRLSLADRSFLRFEHPNAPQHVAGLCVAEGGLLLDAGGGLDLDLVRRRLQTRLVHVPELRRRVRPAPPLCGPPLWIDDPSFALERHVRVAPVAPPGDEAGLLRTTERLIVPPLDRSHPLWELWFLTGLEGGRLGILFKLHHAVADGLGAIALMTSLLGLDPDAPDPPATAWRPAPAPTALALFTDNARRRTGSAASALGHPLRPLRGLARTLRDSITMLRDRPGAPRTSLNALPGPTRRVRVVHLDLATARTVGHAHGAKVNDVVLCVVAGGVRDLLTHRGERVAGLELKVMVPVAMRGAERARDLGNASGVIRVGLPLDEPDPGRHLERIAASSRSARARQHPASGQALFGWLAATGLARRLTERQRVANFFVTNVPGPPVALYVLGARVEDVMPVIGLAGNLTLAFGALSYCGRLSLLVNADAAACPDVDVLAAGMGRRWAELVRTAGPGR
jgi:diacylglycerol O-acyltransferase